MPGGRLNEISAACDETTSNSNPNTLFIMHAGTNDIMDTRSEELLEKYRQMIQWYKSKINKIIPSGIPPLNIAPKNFLQQGI